MTRKAGVTANRYAVVLETGRGRNYRRVFFSYHATKTDAEAERLTQVENQATNVGGTGRFNVIPAHREPTAAQPYLHTREHRWGMTEELKDDLVRAGADGRAR